MRAVRLFAPGDVRCVETDKPAIAKADDVIVKVEACGVCGSDIPRVMKKGAYRYPITIGHEFAGTIEQVGPGAAGLSVGDRVTVMPLIPCGKCDYCKVGSYVTCKNYEYYGSRIDGAMAEYVRVSAANVLKIPASLPFEAAAMTDPTSIALHAILKGGFLPGQRAVVFGLGAIGYLAVQWLKAMGAREVYAVDVLDEKLGLARELGATDAFNGKACDAPKAVMEATGGRGVDLALEISGSKIAQVQALKTVRSLGTVVYCGISYDDLLIPNAELSRILRGELVVRGAWNSSIAPLPVNEWETSIAAMASGSIKTAPLVSHSFMLEQCADCFRQLYDRTLIFNKVMFYPWKK